MLSGGLDTLMPTIKSLRVTNSTPNAMSLETTIDVENPTEYSAIIPFADVKITVNNTILGHIAVRNLNVSEGLNRNLTVIAEYAPMSGEKGRKTGRELLSQWISGK
jgi:hypothetical protein